MLGRSHLNMFSIKKDTRNIFDCIKCLCQLFVIRVRYLCLYSLLIVHLFCSLFNYLFCFHFHQCLLVFLLFEKRKRIILTLNRVQVFRSRSSTRKAEEVPVDGYLFHHHHLESINIIQQTPPTLS
jgi:hypothetical protein